MYYIGKMKGINRLEIGEIILETKKKIKHINCKKIIEILPSKVMPFSKSGAYIPISQDYNNHKVYIIVMENKK